MEILAVCLHNISCFLVCSQLLDKTTERWEKTRDSGGVVYRYNSGCAISNVEVEIMTCSGWPLLLLCSRKISYKVICFPWRPTKVNIAKGIRNMLASFYGFLSTCFA